MARAKKTVKTTPVVTLNREVLPNGMIRLTSPLGIVDIRNNGVHYDVVCSPKKEKYFREVVANEGVMEK